MINLDQERLEAWVATKTEYPPERPAYYIGMEHNGAIVGALMYWRFQYEQGSLVDMELTMFVDRPHSFTRGVLAAGLAYPFDILCAERMTARIETTNKRSIRIAEWAGFVTEGLIRRGRFTDHWHMGMTRDDYGRRFQLS